MANPCPRCGHDGDVAIEGRGRARCNVCRGGFVGVEAATHNLAQVGLNAAKIRGLVEQGQRSRGCPTCDRALATFTVRREFLHACLQCRAVWVDEGAWGRLGLASPRTDPPPYVAASVSTLPAVGLAPPQPPPATWDTPGVPVPTAAPADDDKPFVAAVGGFSDKMGAGRLGAVLFGVAALAICGIIWIAYGALVQSGEAVDVGGGFSVLFWPGDRKTEPFELQMNGGRAEGKRTYSDKGNTHIEVVYGESPRLRGSQGEISDAMGKDSGAFGTFANEFTIRTYGKYVKFDDIPHGGKDDLTYWDFVFFTEEGKGTHGVGRVYVDSPRYFVVTAIGEQKAFADGPLANKFVGSLARR